MPHKLNFQEHENGSCSFTLFGGIEVYLTPISLALWEQLNDIPKLPNGLEDNIEFIIQAVTGLCSQWGSTKSISQDNLIEFLEEDIRNLDILNTVLMRHFPKALSDDVVSSRVIYTPNDTLIVKFFDDSPSEFRKLRLSDMRVISKLPLKKGEPDRFDQLFYTVSLTALSWMGGIDPITPDSVKVDLNHRIQDVLLLEAALSNFNKSDFEL